ncbi:OmpH family outer membrane protein [Xanthomonadaceae bacterium JHOS43]|nr:OmpH family outer membrane protein [Xanthomonadaceae bacterium JHOS43]
MLVPFRPHRLQRLPWSVVWSVALAGWFVLAASATWAQGGSRIGYVDMQRLLTHAPQILDARHRMQREFDARDAELRVDEARLAELDLGASKATNDEDRAVLLRQAEALRRSIERTRQRLRDELASRVDEETEKAWPQINDAIAEHGREQGYDLIVTSPVAYVSGRIDVTDDVLERLARWHRAGER